MMRATIALFRACGWLGFECVCVRACLLACVVFSVRFGATGVHEAVNLITLTCVVLAVVVVVMPGMSWVNWLFVRAIQSVFFAALGSVPRSLAAGGASRPASERVRFNKVRTEIAACRARVNWNNEWQVRAR